MAKPIPSLRERWIRSIQAVHIWRGVEPASAEKLSKEYNELVKKMARNRQESFVINSEGHVIILNAGNKK